MFQSTNITVSLQLSLAKVILILKHSVNLLCGGVAACTGMACILCCAEQD